MKKHVSRSLSHCVVSTRNGAGLAAEAGAASSCRSRRAARPTSRRACSAQKLSEIWGQTVVIENRGGAGGGVGAAEAARAAPDGYTLFFPSGSVVTANQHIYAKMSYDPEKDFVPITKVVSGPQVLDGAGELAVQDGEGADRSCARQPGQAHLRPRRHRLADPPRGRELRLAGEDRRAGGALQGRGPGAGRVWSAARPPSSSATSPLPSATSRAAGCARSASPARARRRSSPACRRSARPSRASRTPAGSASSRRPARRRTIIQKVYRDTKKALEASELRGALYVQGLAPVGNTPEEMAPRDEGGDRALGARGAASARSQVK